MILRGELHVGPDRLSGLGRNLRIRIGLSNLDADKERNLQLLKERGWFDIRWSTFDAPIWHRAVQGWTIFLLPSKK
jgi:hypothetical protein